MYLFELQQITKVVIFCLLNIQGIYKSILIVETNGFHQVFLDKKKKKNIQGHKTLN